MYYEYHLENEMVIKSNNPYENGFYFDCGEQTYCPDLEEWYEVDTFVKVSYCLIKEGDLCKYCKQIDDCICRWDEN
jgi:hypothetical protein